jgi:hypothetical protein
MHVAATFDGTNPEDLHQRASWKPPHRPAGKQLQLTTSLGIGAERWWAQISGRADDIRIYNRALPLTEIQEMIGVATATPTLTETPTDLPTATHTPLRNQQLLIRRLIYRLLHIHPLLNQQLLIRPPRLQRLPIHQPIRPRLRIHRLICQRHTHTYAHADSEQHTSSAQWARLHRFTTETSDCLHRRKASVQSMES